MRAPGTLAAHYAPSARVVLVATDVVDAVAARRQAPIGLIAPWTVTTPDGVVRLADPADAAAYARALYRALRAADAARLATILAVAPDDGPLAEAVRDRLRREAVGSAR